MSEWWPGNTTSKVLVQRRLLPRFVSSGLLSTFGTALLLSLALSFAPQTNTQAQCSFKPNTLSGSLGFRNGSGVGCVPLTVHAFNGQLTDVKDVLYIYEFDGLDESKPVKDTTYTYTKKGIYTVLQLSTVMGKPARACGTVTVYDTLPPKFTFTACRNRIVLTVDDANKPGNYEAYKINWGDGILDSLTANKVTNLAHQYTDANPHLIAVQGNHIVGNCGGHWSELFTPATITQPPAIRQVTPDNPGQIGAQPVTIQIDNPASARYRLQQRRGKGIFQYSNVAATTDTRLLVQADTGRTCYRLVLADTCIQAQPSPEVCYELPRPTTTTAVSGPDWYLPTAFTPNGDGHNDTFGLVSGQPTGSFQLVIYNRWGQAIFATTDPGLGWDGRTTGQPAPTGHYSYQVNWETATGHSTKTGSVVLIR